MRYWGFSLMPALIGRYLLFSVGSPSRWPDSKIIARGFQPPSALMNMLFVALMEIETRLLKKPAAGTSILLSGKKQN